jgi:division/cell wall cluster transcriptional repressor MraZ
VGEWVTLLIGRYEYSLDTKNRLSIPPKFREALQREKGDRLFITSGLEGCLYLFLPSQWNRLLENDLQAFTLPNKEQERAFKRKFFSEATDVELDAAGRALIPAYLTPRAGRPTTRAKSSPRTNWSARALRFDDRLSRADAGVGFHHRHG